jgi:hypothetical protein
VAAGASGSAKVNATMVTTLAVIDIRRRVGQERKENGFKLAVRHRARRLVPLVACFELVQRTLVAGGEQGLLFVKSGSLGNRYASCRCALWHVYGCSY